MITTDNTQTLANALTEIDNLKAQLKSELASHESWQREHLRIDGEQCRQIRELEAELGDLPRAQADMLATIKSQRMVLAEIIKSLLEALLGWMDQPDTPEAYALAHDRAILAMEKAQEYLKQAPITLPERY